MAASLLFAPLFGAKQENAIILVKLGDVCSYWHIR